MELLYYKLKNRSFPKLKFGGHSLKKQIQSMKLRVVLLLFCVSAMVLASTSNCSQGSVLTSGGSCVVADYIEGCFRYASADSCSDCEYNYDLSNGRCNYNEKDKRQCCREFGSNGQCSACQSGLYLKGGACEQAYITGCLLKDKDQCLSCASGYFLDEAAKCTKGIMGCKTYVSKTECKECLSSYFLDRKRCLPKEIVGCSEQVGEKCNKCFAPFTLSDGSTCDIENCSEIGEFGCIECDTSFYVRTDGACYPVELGCQVYRHGQCANCSKGFNLVKGKCSIDGCRNQTEAGCSVCDAGYDLVDKRCRMANCIDAKNGICQICADNYRVKEGKCIKSTINCVDYVGLICRQCAPNFYLGNDSHCQPFQVGCVEYTKGNCSKCLSAFELSGRACVIDGCQTYNSTGCKVCQAGYLSTLTLTCQLENCQKSAKGICKLCNSGYSVDGTGKCSKTDKVCIKIRSNGSCEKCAEGFFVNSAGRCEATKPGCVYENALCKNCTKPFTFVNKSCLILGCKTTNGNGCTQCTAPFALDAVEKNCLIEGCEKYSNTKCDKCTSPYVLTDKGACKIPNCAKSAEGKCLACEGKYVLVGGNCFVEDPSCDEYELTGICKKCRTNFNLNFVMGLCARIVEPASVLEKPKDFIEPARLRIYRILLKIKDTPKALPGEAAAPTGYEYVTLMQPNKTNTTQLITYRRLRPLNYSKGPIGNQTQPPKGYEYQTIQQPNTTQLVFMRRLKRIISSDIPTSLANETEVPDGFYYCTVMQILALPQDTSTTTETSEEQPTDVQSDDQFNPRNKQYTNLITTKVKIVKYGLGSSIGKLIYSSVWGSQFKKNASLKSEMGWKAKYNNSNQSVGLYFLNTVPVARIQILPGADNAYPTLCYIEYATDPDGVNFTRYDTPLKIKNRPKVEPAMMQFNQPINVTAMRIVIDKYEVWPAMRFEVLYQDEECNEDENNVETYDDNPNYSYNGQLFLSKGNMTKSGQYVQSLGVYKPSDTDWAMMNLLRKFNSSKRVNQKGYLYMSQISIPDYSSLYSEENQKYGIDQIGWKAAANQSGEWVSIISYKIVEASIIEIRPTDDGACISEFQIEYSKDLQTYTTINQTFKVGNYSDIGVATINFGPVEAMEIRIKVLKYIKYPAFRFDILYMDESYKAFMNALQKKKQESKSKVLIINKSNTTTATSSASSTNSAGPTATKMITTTISAPVVSPPVVAPVMPAPVVAPVVPAVAPAPKVTPVVEQHSSVSVQGSASSSSGSSSSKSTTTSTVQTVMPSAVANSSSSSRVTTTTVRTETRTNTRSGMSEEEFTKYLSDQKELGLEGLTTLECNDTDAGYERFGLESATGWRSRRLIQNRDNPANLINLTLTFSTNMSVNYIKIAPRNDKQYINEFFLQVKEENDRDFKNFVEGNSSSSSNATVYSTKKGAATVVLNYSSLIAIRLVILSYNEWPGLKLGLFALYRKTMQSTYDISNLRRFDGLEYSKLSSNYPVVFVRYSTSKESSTAARKNSLTCYNDCKPLVIQNNGTVDFKPPFISNYMQVTTYVINDQFVQSKFTPNLSNV